MRSVFWGLEIVRMLMVIPSLVSNVSHLNHFNANQMGWFKHDLTEKETQPTAPDIPVHCQFA